MHYSYVLFEINFEFRYYLEPASPLKSITNTAQLTPSQKQTQLNSATLQTNGTTKSLEENSNNWWSSTNGKNNETTSSRWKLDLLSSNDTNNLFNNNHISAPITTNGSRANGSNNNGTSTIARTLNGTKNGFHLPPPASKAEKTNLFTPDTDFVADFSSANIFDALNNKPSINNNSSTNKPIFMNGNSNANHPNGFELTNGNQMNGNNAPAATDVNKNVGENFADFEHNTIYNAAG